MRARDLGAVARGGVARLTAVRASVLTLPFTEASFDVVTMLEVLEHLHAPAIAAREIVRVARRFVVVSVPSKEDDNPEHVQLFNDASLTQLFHEAGGERIARVRTEHVRGHIVGVVTLS